MTKYLIAFIIVLGTGGLFLYTQSQQAAEPMDSNTNAQTEEENPFGEGSTVVGTLDDSGNTEDESEDDDRPEGTEPSTPPMGENTSTGNAPSSATVSRAELAKHNTQADCWIAYKTTVYDITNWLPRHPGSAGAIAPFCGKAEEFATAFNRQHGTSKDARLQKEGVKEGTLGN